jgi:endonuclease/exonuclease/phosphatase family metal-dependent hydrolase
MRSLLLVICVLWPALASSEPVRIVMMTYNTKHGGRTPYSAGGQMDVIAGQVPRPDVVLLQEMPQSAVSTYVRGLNRRYGFTGRDGDTFQPAYVPECLRMSDNTCAATRSEGSAILVAPRYPIVAQERRYFLAPHYWGAGSAVIRVAIDVGGKRLNVFNVHLPPNWDGASYEEARLTSVAGLLEWARGIDGARVIGGDFNARPYAPSIGEPQRGMAGEYLDAWRLAGSGSGLTNGNPTPRSRLDYLFSDLNGSATPLSAVVPDAPTQSDHRPLVVTYEIAGSVKRDPPPDDPREPSDPPVGASDPPPAGPSEPPPADPTDPAPGGTDDSAAPSPWAPVVFSGTQDLRVPLVERDGRIEIGPLLENARGPHYNGVTLDRTRDLTGGMVVAQLVQAPSTGTTAYAMFTIGTDGNHYRFFIANGQLVVQKKRDDIKYDQPAIAYDPVVHQFLRFRHDGANIIFEAAAADGSAPDAGIVFLYSEPWDPAIPLTAAQIELKAGTSVPEVAPGIVVWDKLRVDAPRESLLESPREPVLEQSSEPVLEQPRETLPEVTPEPFVAPPDGPDPCGK